MMEFKTFGMPRGYRFGPMFGRLSIEKFTEDVIEYFQHCEDTGFIPTLSGMAAHCGTSRKTIEDWDQRRRGDPAFDPFLNIVDQARAYIEADLVQCMLQGKHASPGAFALVLKNNHGFVEKTEQTIDATIRSHEAALRELE